MDLMDKINRAIYKNGWDYSESNGGDYKYIETKIAITHYTLPFYYKITLYSFVRCPELGELLGYYHSDVEYRETITVYDSRSFISGVIYPLSTFHTVGISPSGFDPEKILTISEARTRVRWSNEDLVNATQRRLRAIESYHRDFLGV